MPRKLIKRFLPDHQKIKQNRAINMFGTLLHDANLWHLNRKSARGAFAIGLFNAFIPVPFQMYLSADPDLQDPDPLDPDQQLRFRPDDLDHLEPGS